MGLFNKERRLSEKAAQANQTEAKKKATRAAPDFYGAAAETVKWFVFLFTATMLGMVIATYGIPLLGTWVAGSMRISTESEPLVVLVILAFPMLFIVAMIFAGYLLLMKLWLQWLDKKTAKSVTKHQEKKSG